MKFLQQLASYMVCSEGVILPIAAILFPIIMGVAGLGVDASSWLAARRDLQTAADAAAIAGAWEAAKGYEGRVKIVALKEAVNNGYLASANDDFVVGYLNGDDGPEVTVDISQDVSLWFSSIFIDNARIGTSATAGFPDTNDEFCMLSLDPTSPRTFSTFGTVDIISPGCGIAVNSSSGDALHLSGNVDIDIGSVSIVGDYGVTGGSATFNYGSLETSADPVDDPYEDLEVPPYSACNKGETKKPMSISSSGTVTLNPGVYCGGLKISGTNEIIFNPGVYILDGGDFEVSGGGSMTGEEVAFVLTSSGTPIPYAQLKISGGKEIEFTAPLSGSEMEGVVFYQDRNAPINKNDVNTITGSSQIAISGVTYFPSQGIRYGGTSDIANPLLDPCSKIIARTITLAGTPLLSNSCDGMSVEDIGTVVVRLIK